jgi:hypothetical protein
LREEVDRFGLAFLEEFRTTIEQKVVKPPKPAPVQVVKEKVKVEIKEQPVIPPPVSRPQALPFEDILYR